VLSTSYTIRSSELFARVFSVVEIARILAVGVVERSAECAKE